MCLAYPMKIIAINKEKAVASAGGIKKEIRIDFFEGCKRRGLGVIKKSGLSLKKGYVSFDARSLVKDTFCKKSSVDNCLCGEVIKGKIFPQMCPQFGRKCTPTTSLGPYMVSFEGGLQDLLYLWGKRNC
ncbi:MAG: hypothetical protein DRP68_01840 [Candidatus Omnitrophota bacterium]|nr:MAG: hypothetical protein DRP68_01840 [Candidatus Omnitrophota bacterium]